MWEKLAENKALECGDVPELPFQLGDLPYGWLTSFEASLLFSAGRELDGPFLEVGSWVGRSTVCIARGIQSRPIGLPILFDVVDFGISDVAEWRRLLNN